VIVEGKGQVTGIRGEPAGSPDPLLPRLQPVSTVTDFGWVRTSGALRAEVNSEGVWLTPLPGGEPFKLALRPEKLLGKPVKKSLVLEQVDVQGNAVRQVPLAKEGLDVGFMAEQDAFGYRLREP
jgi:hypothetical protein